MGSGLGGREGGFVLSGLGGGTMLITLDGSQVTLVGSGWPRRGEERRKKVGLKVGDSVGSAVVGSGVIVGEGGRFSRALSGSCRGRLSRALSGSCRGRLGRRRHRIATDTRASASCLLVALYGH